MDCLAVVCALYSITTERYTLRTVQDSYINHCLRHYMDCSTSHHINMLWYMWVCFSGMNNVLSCSGVHLLCIYMLLQPQSLLTGRLKSSELESNYSLTQSPTTCCWAGYLLVCNVWCSPNKSLIICSQDVMTKCVALRHIGGKFSSFHVPFLNWVHLSDWMLFMSPEGLYSLHTNSSAADNVCAVGLCVPPNSARRWGTSQRIFQAIFFDFPQNWLILSHSVIAWNANMPHRTSSETSILWTAM